MNRYVTGCQNQRVLEDLARDEAEEIDEERGAKNVRKNAATLT